MLRITRHRLTLGAAATASAAALGAVALAQRTGGHLSLLPSAPAPAPAPLAPNGSASNAPAPGSLGRLEELSDAFATVAERVKPSVVKRPDDRYGRAETFADALALALSLGSPIPVAVRAWLGGGDEVRHLLAVTLALTGLAVANEGLWEEWAVFVAAALIASVATELTEVRRLLVAGYRLEDLRLAIDHVRAAVRARRGADLAPRRSARRPFADLTSSAVGLTSRDRPSARERPQRFSAHLLADTADAVAQLEEAKGRRLRPAARPAPCGS